MSERAFGDSAFQSPTAQLILATSSENTIIRQATSDDLSAIEMLRRADGDALGFVPKAKYEHIVFKTTDRGRNRWKYEWLIVAEDNGEITGFFMGGFHRNGAKGTQLCVRNDARRMERALKLVDSFESEARRRGMPRVRHRVAADIEANYFWRAAGYTPVAITTSTWLNTRESLSRRPLFIYDKPLDQGQLFDLSIGYGNIPEGPDPDDVPWVDYKSYDRLGEVGW